MTLWIVLTFVGWAMIFAAPIVAMGVGTLPIDGVPTPE
jgi:hypothetical protein